MHRHDETDGERKNWSVNERRRDTRSVLGIPRTCRPDSSGIRVVGEIWKKEEGERIRERTKRETVQRGKERKGDGNASRHTPPEARDANYSGSCEQFVDYPGNVRLIPAGLPGARGYLHLRRIPRL